MACASIPGVAVLGPVTAEQAALVVTPDALAFVATLQRTFNARRKELLQRRVDRQRELDAGRWKAAACAACALCWPVEGGCALRQQHQQQPTQC